VGVEIPKPFTSFEKFRFDVIDHENICIPELTSGLKEILLKATESADFSVN